MAETKVVYHGTTVIDTPPAPGNPPPYSANPGSYGPPPAGPYAPTVVHATVMPGVVPIVITRQMGPSPTVMTCRSCQSEIVTRVDKKPTLRTHLCAVLLCVLVCWPCVCLPYCMDSCLQTDHYCPNCNSYQGSYYV